MSPLFCWLWWTLSATLLLPNSFWRLSSAELGRSWFAFIKRENFSSEGTNRGNCLCVPWAGTEVIRVLSNNHTEECGVWGWEGERKTFGHTISNNTKNQDRAPLSSAATFLEKANVGFFFGGGRQNDPSKQKHFRKYFFFFLFKWFFFLSSFWRELI